MDFTYGMFFNTVFSLLPNFCLGLFDQDVNDKISMQTPQLYQRGIRQLLYNTERFWFYVFDGIYQSVVCYYVAVLVVGESIVDQRGFAVNKDAIGTTAAFYIVFTVNLYMAQNNFSWIWITHMSLWLTLVVWIGYVFLHAAPVDSPTFGVAVLLFQQPSFYLGLILAISVCMFPHILFKFSQQAYFPNDIDIVQEFQKYLYKDGDVVNLEIKSTTTTPLAPAPPPLSQPLQDVKIKGKRRASELDEGMRRAHSEPTVNIIPVDASTTSSRISETGPAGGGGGSSSSSDGGSNTSSLKLALPSSAKSSMRRIKSESILGSILSRLTSPISPSSSSSKQQREPSIVTTIPASDPMNPANIVFTSSPYANPNIDIVDNNESSTTTGRGGTDGARPSKSRQRSNRSTSSQMASIQDILQPLSSVSRRTGEFMRSLPRRLRMSSMASSSSRSADPSRRLVFMGDHAQTVNTGYAFSGTERAFLFHIQTNFIYNRWQWHGGNCNPDSSYF